MSAIRQMRVIVALAAMAVAAASPALAQGRGNGNGNGRPDDRGRPSLERRDDRDDRDDRRDRRYDRDDDRDRRSSSWEEILVGRYDSRTRAVPPGWCRGRGNPHNNRYNCGYFARVRYDWNPYDRWGGYGSYPRAHAAFHRMLDREYDLRRASGLLDLVRLRALKAHDHEQWHRRMGTRH